MGDSNCEYLSIFTAVFAPENIVVAGINELKSSFCTLLSPRLVIYEHNDSPQCQRLLVDIYP